MSELLFGDVPLQVTFPPQRKTSRIWFQLFRLINHVSMYESYYALLFVRGSTYANRVTATLLHTILS